MTLALALAAASAAPLDAEEAGRIAFVRFTEAPGVGAVDRVLDGLRAELLERHGVVMVERRECGAPDLDALACLRDADPSIGALLQIGSGLGDDAPVVATVDCVDEDRFERRVGGPFGDDAAARRWGATVVAAALLGRLRACAALPARVASRGPLPAGTVVRVDGRRLGTLEVERPLEVTSLSAGRRRFELSAERFEMETFEVQAVPRETVQVDVDVERIRQRPRWPFLALSVASVGAGVAFFVARHEQRSGDCISTGDCALDAARDARLEGETDLGAPATALVAGGAGLGVAELVVPRREPWWLVALIGAASAGVGALPWLL